MVRKGLYYLNGIEPAETYVLARGNPHVRGDKVGPGFPQVLSKVDPVLPSPPKGAKTAGRRCLQELLRGLGQG